MLNTVVSAKGFRDRALHYVFAFWVRENRVCALHKTNVINAKLVKKESSLRVLAQSIP